MSANQRWSEAPGSSRTGTNRQALMRVTSIHHLAALICITKHVQPDGASLAQRTVATDLYPLYVYGIGHGPHTRVQRSMV